jgi:hypothetical protein
MRLCRPNPRPTPMNFFSWSKRLVPSVTTTADRQVLSCPFADRNGARAIEPRVCDRGGTGLDRGAIISRQGEIHLDEPARGSVTHEHRMDRGIQQGDDLRVVVGDRVDILEGVVGRVVHECLRLRPRHEVPTAVQVVEGFLPVHEADPMARDPDHLAHQAADATRGDGPVFLGLEADAVARSFVDGLRRRTRLRRGLCVETPRLSTTRLDLLQSQEDVPMPPEASLVNGNPDPDDLLLWSERLVRSLAVVAD